MLTLLSDAIGLNLMCDLAIRGGIMANDCGTGKTNTTYLAIHYRALNLAKAREYGLFAGPFRPTMIMCPSGVVEVWYADWVSYWRGILDYRQFYSTPSTVCKNANDNRPARVINSKAADLEAFVNSLDPNDPKTATVVIVTAYTTFQKRIVQIKYDPLPGYQFSDADHIAFAERFQGNQSGDENGDENSDNEADAEGGATSTLSAFVADEAVEDNGLEADDQLEEPTMSYTVSFKAKFPLDLVFFDEAHALKNPSADISRACLQIDCQAKIFSTATPMLNRAVDMIGYLNHFWSLNWSFTLPSDALFDPVQIYSPDFDPRRPISLSGHVLPSCLDTSNSNIENQRFITDISNGERPWLVHPDTYASLVSNPGEDFSENVLAPIQRYIQIRRTMATSLALGDGNNFQLGQDLKPCTISTVELRYRGDDLRKYQAFAAALGPQLKPPPIDKCEVTPDYISAGKENAGVRRRMQLHTTHLEFDKMMSETRRMSNIVHMEAAILAQIEDLGAGQGKKHPKKAKGGQHPEDDFTAGGTAEVNHMYEADTDGGMSHFFWLTCDDPRIAPYPDRVFMLNYILQRCPKLQFLVCQLWDWLYKDHYTANPEAESLPDNQDNRVVVYVMHPLTQL
jgi:SNF2-related domain